MRASGLLLVALSCASAAMVQPHGLRASSLRTVARRSSHSMLLPELGAAATPVANYAAAATLPSSMLVADVFDAIQGFASSPFVLLIPIGAGSVVAAIIIYILVKSAG